MIPYRLFIISLISLFYLPTQLLCMEQSRSLSPDFDTVVNDQNQPLVQTLESLLIELRAPHISRPYKEALLQKPNLLNDPEIRNVSQQIYAHPEHYAALKKAVEVTHYPCSETYAREQIIPCWHKARTILKKHVKERMHQESNIASGSLFVLSALHLTHLKEIYPIFEAGEQAVKEALNATPADDEYADMHIVPFHQNLYLMLSALIPCTPFSML